jgi:hypothetical protein
MKKSQDMMSGIGSAKWFWPSICAHFTDEVVVVKGTQ